MGKLTCPVRILGRGDEDTGDDRALLSEGEDTEVESDSEASSTEDFTEAEDMGAIDHASGSNHDTPVEQYAALGAMQDIPTGETHTHMQTQPQSLRVYGTQIQSFISRMERRHEAERRWWWLTTARAMESNPQVAIRRRLTCNHLALLLQQQEYRERMTEFLAPKWVSPERSESRKL